MTDSTLDVTNPVSFSIYVEPADKDIVWWAETDAIPGLSVAAPTLMQLRILIDEAVQRHLGAGLAIDLDLATDDDEYEQSLPIASDLPKLPVGTEVRKILLPVA